MGATVQVDAFVAAFEAWRERTIEATRQSTRDAGNLVRDAVQENLAQRTYPPASPVGEPPALRTGYLHDSVYVRTLATESGWQARVYPSTVYARIQELSGWAGRGHRSFLPARPYVRPATESTAPRVRQVYVDGWRAAMPGG